MKSRRRPSGSLETVGVRLTFSGVGRLVLVDSGLDVAEGRRGSKLLQNTDGVTKLICKLHTQKQNTQFRLS